MNAQDIEADFESEIADSDDEFDGLDAGITLQSKNLTEKQIEQIFDQGRFRLHQDRNDFTLPQVLDFVEGKKWMNIRPAYQRRLRWDRKKKSRLIESFLMNVPVPAIFLYEFDLNRYEVMDGQQRLSTILEFYSNEFKLTGLSVWSSLNGKQYSKLPPRIQRGLDRGKLSSIILISDASIENDPAIGDIRTQVFDRLNTGGVKLNAQELRNCLFSGPFNEMVTESAADRRFTDVWGIPPHEEHIRDDGYIGDLLRQNSLFNQMKDCEIVLRFFAFRKSKDIRGSVRSMLDRYMGDNRFASKEIIDELRTRYFNALELAIEVFGDSTFRLPKNESGKKLLSRPLYDAIMITFDRLSDRHDEILSAKNKINAGIVKALGDEEIYSVVVGRPNTATAIKNRLSSVFSIIQSAIN